MPLKDFRWNIEGDEEVYPGLMLRDPEFRVASVLYHPETRTAQIEVVFTEGLAPHSRFFELEVPGNNESLSAAAIRLFIVSLFPHANQTELPNANNGQGV